MIQPFLFSFLLLLFCLSYQGTMVYTINQHKAEWGGSVVSLGFALAHATEGKGLWKAVQYIMPIFTVRSGTQLYPHEGEGQ